MNRRTGTENSIEELEELLKRHMSDIAYLEMRAAHVRAEIISLKMIAKNENSTGN
jgi:hypothetical protein